MPYLPNEPESRYQQLIIARMSELTAALQELTHAVNDQRLSLTELTERVKSLEHHESQRAEWMRHWGIVAATLIAGLLVYVAQHLWP